MEVGDKVKFTDEMKSKINYDSDYLFYIKNDEFDVSDVKGDLVKIKGMGMWGFTKSSQFTRV